MRLRIIFRDPNKAELITQDLSGLTEIGFGVTGERISKILILHDDGRITIVRKEFK